MHALLFNNRVEQLEICMHFCLTIVVDGLTAIIRSNAAFCSRIMKLPMIVPKGN